MFGMLAGRGCMNKPGPNRLNDRPLARLYYNIYIYINMIIGARSACGHLAMRCRLRLLQWDRASSARKTARRARRRGWGRDASMGPCFISTEDTPAYRL